LSGLFFAGCRRLTGLCGSGLFMPVVWVLAAMGSQNHRAEGRRSHRGIVSPCGSGLQTAILFPGHRAAGRRSHRCLYLPCGSGLLTAILFHKKKGARGRVPLKHRRRACHGQVQPRSGSGSAILIRMRGELADVECPRGTSPPDNRRAISMPVLPQGK